MSNLAPHGGCNWEGCKVCFPHLQNKLPVTDEEQYNRAVEIANGSFMRHLEYLDPIAVARHAMKLLSR
jgi:hypothetical protein